MSPLRYKTLLTYLPGMASVVNVFSSPQVQSNVYEMLMEALDTKLEAEGLGRDLPADNQPTVSPMTSSGELAHDLIEGDNIHTEQVRRKSISTTTVI